MTVEKLAWIVGVELGTMHEDQDCWGSKILGGSKQRRISKARNLVYLALYDTCGVSYKEIAEMLNRRHESVIGRGIKWTRDWIAADPEAARMWKRIDKAIKDTLIAERKHHAQTQKIAVGLTD
jgi:hypothetical protein